LAADPGTLAPAVQPSGARASVEPAAGALPPSPPKAICPACGKGTPVGFAFCQHCGQRLASAAPGAAAGAARNAPAASLGGSGAGAAAGSGPASTPMVTGTIGHAHTVAVAPPNVTPTPPAGMPRNPPAAAAAPRVAPPPTNAAATSGHGGNGSSTPNDAFAQTLGPATDAHRPAMTAPRPASIPGTTQPDLAPPVLAVTHGTLVAVNRDGSDGRTIELTGETFDIGRTEGSLNFADDPYLAARHARIVIQNGKVLVRPLDSVNGVFVKVQTCDLAPGDSFLVGKELLRYEPLAPEERDPPSLVEHGVRIFGSAPREAWGRLRQLTIAGTARDVWHLTRPELVLGREEGDVTFPDDEFMSRRHAAVKRVGQRARLEDLGSSNGTFVRVRGDRELSAGDLMRVGDQLLRYEP
jgi:pSer/pThr/pTyr-binding forkhead associated (FHA) protein